MNKVQGVSLPRCGHNMLVKHLHEYFRSQDVCPDYRKQMLPFLAKAKARRTSAGKITPKNFHYCEYYYSCRSTPCCNANNTFQKSHDFELDLPLNNSKKYIVQTRNHIDLMISWFELRLPRKREIDSAEGFLAFMCRNQSYLTGFEQRWINRKIDQRLVLDYDDYLSRPVESLEAAIQIFDVGNVPDRARIRRIVRDVRPARDSRDFRFYEAAKSNTNLAVPESC